MADKYQTQCPHCGVKFQISAQQLTLASGNVRCGSCLQVFQASQNLIPLASTPPPSGVGSARGTGPASARPSAQPAPATPPSAPRAPARPAASAPVAPAAPTAPVTPPAARVPPPMPPAVNPAERTQVRPAISVPPPAPRAPAGPAADDDLADMILRELDEAPAAAPVPATPPATAPAPQWSAPPPAAGGNVNWGAPPPRSGDPVWTPPAPREPQWAAPKPAEQTQEAVALRYGLEDNKTKIQIGGGVIDESLVERDDDIFGGAAATMLDEIDEPVDESWAKELLGEKVEDEKDKRVRQFTEHTADKLTLADPTGVQKKSALQQRMDQISTGKAGDSAAGRGSPANDLDDLDFLGDGALTMQDVELPGMEPADDLGTRSLTHEVAWGREIFWGALGSVFLLVLLAQYLTFNFATLSRDDAWRGIYEVSCGAIGCKVPGRDDILRIQGANLVIRSHPAVGGALVVDAIVYNRAPFAQPFPQLELVFSDRAGHVLAGRVFTPEEYLKGELAGSDSMPPDTPVHLSLELVDPGTEAVNYELRFLPSDASS